MIEVKNQEITDNSNVDDVSKFPRRDNFIHDNTLELPGRTILISNIYKIYFSKILTFNIHEIYCTKITFKNL